MVRQLPKVAESGLVRVPSKYSEVSRHDAPHLEGCSRKHRGAMHHRWIFTVQENELLAIPKLPYLEHDESFKEVEEVVLNDPWLIWPTVMVSLFQSRAGLRFTVSVKWNKTSFF